MHTLIQRMILCDINRDSIPTRYFSLDGVSTTNELESPWGNFYTEAELTGKSFALKAFPFVISEFKIVTSGNMEE